MRRWLQAAAAAAVLSGAQAPLPKGEIGGVVRSVQTREVLKSVHVSLKTGSTSPPVLRSMPTNAEGKFLFQNLPAATYTVNFEKIGYADREKQPTTVALRKDQQIVDVEGKLWRAAVISGRVLDADGEPLWQAEVQAYAVTYRNGKAGVEPQGRTASDDEGVYRIYGLPAGKYIVAAWMPPQEGAKDLGFPIALTYYPKALSPSEALRLSLKWGDQLGGIDLQIPEVPVSVVTGAVFHGLLGNRCVRCVVEAYRLTDSFLVTPGRAIRVAPSGTFTIGGLTPGSYKIIAGLQGGETLTASRQIHVEANKPQAVSLVVGPGRTVSGRMVFENPPPDLRTEKINLMLSATRAPATWPVRSSTVEGNGLDFQMDEVPPETYRFEVSPLPQGGYLKSLRLAGVELPAPELIVPDDSSPTGVEVVVAFDGATVSGRVQAPRSAGDDSSGSEARVVLVPSENQSAYIVERSVSTDAGGRFTLQAVFPGSYTLFALPRNSTVEALDPEVRRALASYGKDVKLEPRGRVSLELILAPTLE